jgi:hypothetical protein
VGHTFYAQRTLYWISRKLNESEWRRQNCYAMRAFPNLLRIHMPFINGSTSPLLGPGRFFSFVILYTVHRNPWTGEQSVARPLPTQTSMPRVGFEPPTPVFKREKSVHASDRAATVTGSHRSQLTIKRGVGLCNIRNFCSTSMKTRRISHTYIVQMDKVVYGITTIFSGNKTTNIHSLCQQNTLLY